MPVQDFFEEYAAALEQFDAKKVRAYYTLPCLLASDDTSTAFTDATVLEALFIQGFSFLKQYGIVHCRPDVLSRREWSPRLTKARVQWHYFNAQNEPLYSCDYNYILHLQKDSAWKIEVSVSVNEKERLNAFLHRV